jgi:hypothetical protein
MALVGLVPSGPTQCYDETNVVIRSCFIRSSLHLSLVFLDDIGRNDKVLNLAGSFVYLCDSGVAVMTLSGHFCDVSHSTAKNE